MSGSDAQSRSSIHIDDCVQKNSDYNYEQQLKTHRNGRNRSMTVDRYHTNNNEASNMIIEKSLDNKYKHMRLLGNEQMPKHLKQKLKQELFTN